MGVADRYPVPWQGDFSLAFCLALLCLALAGSPWPVLALVIGSSLWICLIGDGMDMREYGAFFMPALPILLPSLLWMAVEIGQAPPGALWFRLGSLVLWSNRELALRSLYLGARVAASLSVLRLLTAKLPLERLLALLQRWGLPALLADLLFLSLRFSYVLGELAAQMTRAARARLGFSSLRSALASMGLIGGNLWVLAAEKAGWSYMAMEARGYRGRLALYAPEPPGGKAPWLPGVLWCLALLALALVWRG